MTEYVIITNNRGGRLIRVTDGDRRIFVPIDPTNPVYRRIAASVDISSLTVINRDEWGRAKKIAWMKGKRRDFLRACDWCVASDSQLTTAQKNTVTTYRAALRAMGDTVTAAQVDAATTKAQLLALFPTIPAIVDSSM